MNHTKDTNKKYKYLPYTWPRDTGDEAYKLGRAPYASGISTSNSDTNVKSRYQREEIDCNMEASFAGRLGGNLEFTLNRNNPANQKTLERVPDAASAMTFKEELSLSPIREVALWKAGFVEGIGMLL